MMIATDQDAMQERYKHHRFPLRSRTTLFMASCIYTVLVVVITFQTRRKNFSMVDDPATITGGNNTCSLNCVSVVSPLLLLSKTIVVRRAYFDMRKRDGHENAVVFVLEIERSVTSKIFTGCRIGTTESFKTHFRYPKQYFAPMKCKPITKRIALVDCYDVHVAKDRDPAYLIIENFKIGSAIIKRGEVESQQNVVVPYSARDHSPTVVTCVATVRYGPIPPSKDGMLSQWLKYQKTIGVDHVHMIAEDTFVSAGGVDDPYIQDAVKENYLSIDFWPRWFNETEMYHSSQHLAYNDCVYRFMGTYDYIVFADSDDFFVPVKTSKSIKTYLKKWCSGKRGSCRFEWHQFYPDCGWSPKSVGADGNLTATVHYPKTMKLKDTKSAYQQLSLVDVGAHHAMVSIPGYRENRVPSNEAYFAHLRKGQTPRGGC